MNISEQLPSRFDAVPPFIATVVKRLQTEFPLSEQDIFDIKLVLEESLTNAIKHGNQLKTHLSVDVSVMTEQNCLIMTVKDQGSGFDVNCVPDPTAQDKLMRTSGRGVFLIKKLMDEVRYANYGRELTMVKRFKANF